MESETALSLAVAPSVSTRPATGLSPETGGSVYRFTERRSRTYRKA